VSCDALRRQREQIGVLAAPEPPRRSVILVGGVPKPRVLARPARLLLLVLRAAVCSGVVFQLEAVQAAPAEPVLVVGAVVLRAVLDHVQPVPDGNGEPDAVMQTAGEISGRRASSAVLVSKVRV
jgi:hypothetical protein